MRALVMLGVMWGLVGSAPAAPKKQGASSALVIVLDRSGSMAGRKLEAAKRAALAAISSTRPGDTVAVISFDSESLVLVAPKPSSKRKEIEAELGRLEAGGGTNIFPALVQARDTLEAVKASRKHVIVLSDGEAPSDGIVELVKAMRAEKTTISAVGVDGADMDLLGEISDAGGGRLYKVADLDKLSRVFVQETRIALQSR